MNTYAVAYFDEDYALRLRYVEVDDYRVSGPRPFKHPENYKPPGLNEIDVFAIEQIAHEFDLDIPFAEQLNCRLLGRMLLQGPAWSAMSNAVKNPVTFCEQLLHLIANLKRVQGSE